MADYLTDEEVSAFKNDLIRAFMIADDAHAGVLDKGGKPYIGHIRRVAARVTLNPKADSDHVIIATLHDVVEDCDRWPLERLAQWFDPEIIADLDALTRRKGRETYMEFIGRIKERPRATLVKMADLEDNMSPERIAQLPEEERGILRRYERAWHYLLNDFVP